MGAFSPNTSEHLVRCLQTSFHKGGAVRLLSLCFAQVGLIWPLRCGHPFGVLGRCPSIWRSRIRCCSTSSSQTASDEFAGSCVVFLLPPSLHATSGVPHQATPRAGLRLCTCPFCRTLWWISVELHCLSSGCRSGQRRPKVVGSTMDHRTLGKKDIVLADRSIITFHYT